MKWGFFAVFLFRQPWVTVGFLGSCFLISHT
ncbi:MAG: hypothetical protein J6B34_01855 [Clostridia bacterium]|nr:hypothetical protein [Clostridia bacterium]